MAPTSTKILSLFCLLFLTLLCMSYAKRQTPKSSAYDFIKHLQGCHKGDKIKGLHHLKDYLKEFGYLNYHHSKSQTHAHDDDFDDLLEAAIKTYQLNYHLKPTGSLDPQTVSKMVKPRCGVPDIVNGTNWMKKPKGKQPPNSGRSTFIHTVSHYSFFQGNPKWRPSKTQLTYAFYPNTDPVAIRPAANAFNTWASATQFRFSQVENAGEADIKIGFFGGDHGDGHSFDGPGGTLAHAYPPEDGRFHYDAQENWAVGAVAGAYDLETVALHEIGHLLGLGHSEVESAIMYPSISSGATKGLDGDDIQGIRALYNV